LIALFDRTKMPSERRKRVIKLLQQALTSAAADVNK
jgi:hypothetical protein